MRAHAILLTADRAHLPPHRAADRDLLFDTALNLPDKPVRLRSAQHIRPALEHRHAVLRQNLRVKNPRHLLFRRPRVVHDPRLPYKKRRQLPDTRLREPLVVPVNLIVAQPHGKHIHVLRRNLRLRQPVDFLQLLLARRAAQLHICRLRYLHVVSPCFSISFSACAR